MQTSRRQLTRTLCYNKRYLSHNTQSSAQDEVATPVSASEHLFKLAEQEEAREQAVLKAQAAIQSDKAWDGQESTHDAVLRMLHDQHKPLRVKGWKREIQQPTSRPVMLDTVASDQEAPQAKGQTLAEREGRAPYPWEAVYRAPSHHLGLPSIKHGVMVPRSSRTKSKVERLMLAREASVDYTETDSNPRIKKYHQEGRGRKPMPGSIAAWTTLVEEKIQEARQAGLFKNVKGRGKPFVKDINESNPYLERTEFLMNRIVRKQQAAPAWIELQQQVDSNLETFRNTLKDSWIRRAVRMLSLDGVAHLSPSYIAQSAITFRDPEWEARERSYHEASMQSLNDQVRAYNFIAPAITRRAPYVLDKELQDCFAASAPMIQTLLEQRVHDVLHGGSSTARGGQKKGKRKVNRYGIEEDPLQEIDQADSSIWQAVKRLFV